MTNPSPSSSFSSRRQTIIGVIIIILLLGLLTVVLLMKKTDNPSSPVTSNQQTQSDKELTDELTNPDVITDDSPNEPMNEPANEAAEPEPAPQPTPDPSAENPTSTPDVEVIDTLIFHQNLDSNFTQGYTYVASGQKFVATGKPTFVLPNDLKNKFQANGEKVNALYAPIYGEKNNILFFSTETPSVSKSATTIG